MLEDIAPWTTPALLVGLFAWLRADIRGMEDRFRSGMNDMRSEMQGRIKGLDGRLRAVKADLAELRGRVSFIQDCILRRNAPLEEPAAAERCP